MTDPFLVKNSIFDRIIAILDNCNIEHVTYSEVKPNPTVANAAHCMEKTQMVGSGKAWQRIFAHFGLTFNELATGCCGMSGTYGHESEHRELSARIYAQSWQEKVARHQDRLLATGYSCRSQVKREDRRTALHPLQILLQTFNAPDTVK